MMKRTKYFLLILILFICFNNTPSCAGNLVNILESDIEIGGHYKNQFTYMRLKEEYIRQFPSLDIDDYKDTTRDDNIFRLKLKARPAEDVILGIEYEIITSNFGSDLNELLQGEETSDQYLDRAFIGLTSDDWNVTVGRQRISWGTGLVWNPTDLFNPPSPFDVGFEQKRGVDALHLQYYPDGLTSISLVYSPEVQAEDGTGGLRLATHMSDYDMSVSYVRSGREDILGADFAGQVYDLGIYGEGTFRYHHDSETEVWEAVAGLKYSWSKVYLGMEYLYSDDPDAVLGGADDLITAFGVTSDKASENHLFSGVMIDCSDLIDLGLNGIVDMDGGGFYVSPNITWSLHSNVDLSAGVQAFNAPSGDQFAQYPNTAYAHLKAYF